MLPAYSPGGTCCSWPGSLRATPIVPGNGRSGMTTPGRNSVTILVQVEIEIFDLAVLVDLRELPEHAGHVEVRRIGARHDLVDPHLEHVAGLRAFDIDRPGEGVRPAAREVGAQLLDLLDGRAGDDLVVAVHHRFEHDGVAGLDPQHRRLRVVEPAPLRGLERRRQQMHGLAAGQRDRAQLRIGRTRCRLRDRRPAQPSGFRA